MFLNPKLTFKKESKMLQRKFIKIFDRDTETRVVVATMSSDDDDDDERLARNLSSTARGRDMRGTHREL